MVYTAAFLTALGRRLLWFGAVAGVVAVAEHVVPAGRTRCSASGWATS